MASKTLSLNKLVSSDFSEGVSWVLNKGGGDDTDIGYFVFNGLGVGSVIVSKVSFKINSIKTGGNNLLQEDVNLNFEFGTYSGTTFTKSSAFSFSSQKVKESERQTSKTATASGSATLNGDTLCIKLTLTPGSKEIGDKIIMSGFTLDVTYEIPHTHSYTTTTVPATCTATGSKTETCSCGDTKTTTLAKDPNNHSGSLTTTPAKSPTCTESGYTESKKWSCCGVVTVAQTPVSALGHSFTATTVADTYLKSAATCTSAAVYYKSCSRCGLSSKGQTGEVTFTSGSALGHNYEFKGRTPATSSSNGYATYTCSRCGHSYTTDSSYLLDIKCDNKMGYIVCSASTVTPGTQEFRAGDDVTINVYAETGYRFVKWSDGNTDNPRTIKISGYSAYEAVFEKIKYTIKFVDDNNNELQSLQVAHGDTPKYSGATPSKQGNAQYRYEFTGWTPELVPATANATYKAVYEERLNYYVISTSVQPEGAGTVTGIVSGNSLGYGWQRTIKAEPNTGWAFKQWSDGNTDVERTITVSGDATYTAVFEKIKYNVVVNCGEGGTFTGLSSGNNEVEHGQSITITANSDAGYEFWGFRIFDLESDEVIQESSDNPLTLTVTRDLIINIFFEVHPPEFTRVELIHNSKQISPENKVITEQGYLIFVQLK